MRAVLEARGVFRGPVAAMFMPAFLAPAVVDHDVVLDRRVVEQPSEQLLASPILARHVPLAVAEDDRRLVARHHVLKLREHVLVHVALAVRKPERVEPLIKRVIETELHPALTHRLGQLPHQVALRPDLGRIPWPTPGLGGFGAGPQAEALVVFRGRNDVFGAGAEKDLGPLVGVEELERETAVRNPCNRRSRRNWPCDTATRGCRAPGHASCSNTTRHIHLPCPTTARNKVPNG